MDDYISPWWDYLILVPVQTAARKLRDVVEKRAIAEDLTAVLAQIKEVTRRQGAWLDHSGNGGTLW